MYNCKDSYRQSLTFYKMYERQFHRITWSLGQMLCLSLIVHRKEKENKEKGKKGRLVKKAKHGQTKDSRKAV